MIRRSSILWSALLAATLSSVFSVPTYAAAPGSLDELLEQTRTARQREAEANKAREQKFIQQRDQRSQMLAQAKAERDAQKRRSDSLGAEFDANEKKLTDLTDQLKTRSGNLGEMFGVVRQVSGDFSGVTKASMISAQYPDRQAFVDKMAQSKALPSIDDLERLWFEMQREMTATGKVAKFNAKIIMPDGNEENDPVVSVGGFVAVTDKGFLNYLPDSKEFTYLARQPASRYVGTAKDLVSATSGYTAMTIDPSRGTLLSILVQTPELGEQISYGGLVGNLILVIGAIGVIIAIYRFFVLLSVGAKVSAQRKNIDKPSEANPLGRVLNVYFKDPGADTETLQLRLDEAVLKEVPALETGLGSLKMIAAVAPLMGLLGTVTGMIVTFQQITLFGTGDPKIMADGISQALITTVEGLVVAIPMVLLHAFLSSRSKAIVQTLDEEAAGLIAESAEKSHA